VILLGGSILVSAQSAASDPWSRVPAAPTGCYFDAGDIGRFDAASATLTTDYDRQKKINDDLAQQFEHLDMNVKMQRMQAFMMKDPQKAMQVMQAMQAGATTMTSQVHTSSAEGPKLDEELTGIRARYKTEVQGLLKPFDEKAAAFAKAHTQLGEAGPYFPSKADETQWTAMMHERNTAYEKICGNWWGASGPVQGWLTKYRTFLAKEAQSYEANDGIILVQMQIMESPSGGYRSVYAMEAVRKYLEKARKVIEDRPDPGLTTGWLR